MKLTTDLYLGDCREELKKIPCDSVDLIVTSPPYADQRKSTYGGIVAEEYVEWFMPAADEFLRVLKPSGTFILNIKEKVVDGERSTYVMELILEMRKRGWLWTEEFIWHKKNCFPGKWSNRFRDAWERLLQFNKNRKFNMYQDAVRIPVGDWAKNRLKNLSETDKVRDSAKNGSGFGKNVSNWIGREMVYPTNVIHLSTECGNKNHSAAFPRELPEWFVKLFTRENDTVLDPFMGSGTTIEVANKLRRNAIGVEIVPEYYDAVRKRFAAADTVDGKIRKEQKLPERGNVARDVKNQIIRIPEIMKFLY
ncbi:MAG: site-specific DNA-methyltransferase [Prevotellaceae bacterium]|jgi:site-specific DNA-methyltransferase (adenine-specific)/site-specific DNA-methyltransferase (cytosine-N4-specific)|nr:site-specific DNA-methyltransferase [Prevotellaceae bacterium]